MADTNMSANLTHEPSMTPTRPSNDGVRRPQQGYMPGAIDIIRSMDGVQSAAATARLYTEGQVARNVSKRPKPEGPQYTSEQAKLRAKLKSTSRGVGRNIARAKGAAAAISAMPPPGATVRAWTKWAQQHNQVAPVAGAPTTISKLGEAASSAHRTLARINPALMVTSGAVAGTSAYRATKAAGGSTAQAVGAAAIAGSPIAAAAAVPSLAARFAPAAAGALSKVALPLTAFTAGVGAVRGGLAAYRDGKSAGRIAGEAALGAADALTFGLAGKAHAALGGDPTSLAIVKQAEAAQKNAAAKPSTKPVGSPNDGPQRLPPSKEKDFRAANTKFETTQATPPDEPGAAGPGYKDVWSDSRGRTYKRQDMSVRTAEDKQT